MLDGRYQRASGSFCVPTLPARSTLTDARSSKPIVYSLDRAGEPQGFMG